MARRSLTVWLDKRRCWFATAIGKRGRSPKFSDAAIQFCLTLKIQFGLALRQTTGLVESVLHLCGLAWLQHALQRSCSRLPLLVDSTGIKFLGEGEWKCKKHGSERRRQWRKLHIGIDAKTLQIRAVYVASNNVSDATVIPDLLQQLPKDEVLAKVTPTGHSCTSSIFQAF